MSTRSRYLCFLSLVFLKICFTFLWFQLNHCSAMPEARDRLSRPVDVAAMFARRRSAAVGVLVDDTENGADLFRSPIRQQPAATATGVRTPMGFGATTRGGGSGVGIGRGGLGTPRTGNSRFRSSFRSSSAAAVASRENTPAPGIVRRGRGRGRSGVLPYWYPRTPLRDITAIARVRICFLKCLISVIWFMFDVNVDFVI